MSTIVFLTGIILGALCIFFGKRRNSAVLLSCGALLGLGICAWYFYSMSSTFRQSKARTGAENQFHAEAYALAMALKETSGEKGGKTLILGVRTPEEMDSYIAILRENGVENTEYVQVFENLPIGVPTNTRLKRIRSAMEQVPDARIIVAMGPGVLLNKDCSRLFGKEKKAVQTGSTVDGELWEKGIIAAHVKVKRSVSQSDLSGNPEKAALQGYEIIRP